MSIGACVARAVCLALMAEVASAQESAPAVSSPPARAATGLLLDRLSKGHLRIWRAVENVAASNASGRPRCPTLRRLWDWARVSPHSLHIEMVSPFGQPAGTAGLFRVERIDPAGLHHVVVIRLCPKNIRLAVVGRDPDSVEPFVRFQGLTDAERYGEVLAHELAHAEYFLESAERLAQLEAAQHAIRAFRSARVRANERVPEDLVRRLPEPFALLAAFEAHAESVEAAVLRELAGDRPSPTPRAGVRPPSEASSVERRPVNLVVENP